MQVQKQKDDFKIAVLSNGKTILNMTEEEYLETEEGSTDIFAVNYQNAHKIQKDISFNENFEEKFKEVSNLKTNVRKLHSKTANEGFKCLGFKDDKNYIWSNYRQCLFSINHKDLTQNNFINMFGLQFLKDNYQAYDSKTGEPRGFDIKHLSGDLIDGCVQTGVFNLKNMHGFGIFVDPENKDHLIINGESIWGTNPNFKGNRIHGKNVYVNIKDLDFEKNIECAKKEEFKEWFDLLGTWNYKRGYQDQLLSFGWTLTAPFSGCVNWRTHFSLTGEQGTGKSTLQNVSGNFMGEFALLFDGQSSEAGIRQKVGSSSCTVLIDEAEADSRKIANTLTFFRTASSSGIVAKGTSDQTGMDFVLKLTGMIGGIVAPALNPADLSRFLRIELLPKGEVVHPLLIDIDRQNEIGKKCIMYIIKNYKLFKSVCKKVRKLLLEDNNNSRYADSFTVIIAGAYLGLNHNDDSVKIKEFMKSFDFDKEKTAMQTKDHNNLLNKILKAQLNDPSIGSFSIIELINGYFNDKNKPELKKDIKRTLSRSGIKVEQTNENYKLYIATKDENFLKIMKNSKFDAGDILSVLMRLENTELINDSVMLGGVRQSRSTVICIDLNKNDYTFAEEDKV